MRFACCALLIFSLCLTTGCVTNPVTGKNELGLVSDAQERQIGEQQYAPSRQMQGGDYKTDPALAEYVSEIGQKLAAVSDRPLDYEFTVLNNSVPNAWALPGGKIAVNRGLLLEMSSEAELAAVLGHEIVHAAARHGAKGIQRGLLLQGAVLATAVASRDSDYSQYAVGGAAIAAQLVNQKYGRDQELESDRYGMEYMSRAGYHPQGAVDLQETFVRLSEGRRQDWLSGLFASHPPSSERVDANRATASILPDKGMRGEREYQAAIAHLKATQPAYEAHDEGRKALAEGDVRKALRLADQALDIEPQEAQFYGLKGDAEFARRRYDKAIGHYTEALRRDDSYFKYYLGRGESHRRRGRIAQARQDLANSAKLLPTADAYHSLGQMAEAEGQIDRALELYGAAAGSASPAGKNAQERMVRLDLPRNPDRYVAVTKRVDQSGRVYAELGNLTPLALGQIAFVAAWRDDQGTVRQQRQVYAQAIPSGQSALMLLGAGDYARHYDTLELAVRSARIQD